MREQNAEWYKSCFVKMHYSIWIMVVMSLGIAVVAKQFESWRVNIVTFSALTTAKLRATAPSPLCLGLIESVSYLWYAITSTGKNAMIATTTCSDRIH